MHSGSQPAAAAALTDRVEMGAVGSMKVRKAYGLCSTVGSSLFCFSVYRKNKGTYDADDQALDLLKTQHK